MEGERENGRKDEVEGRAKRKGEGTEKGRKELMGRKEMEISGKVDGRSEKPCQLLLEIERVFYF